MVLRSIKSIKEKLPEVLHIVMFYNDGIVFQTTFDQEVNIPKLGENLASSLNHLKNLYEITGLKLDNYEKLIFETNGISLIILKLGEDSNLALFFKENAFLDRRLKSIREYLKKIEELVDVDKRELELQELEQYEVEIVRLKNLFNQKENDLHIIDKKIETIDKSSSDIKELLREKGDLTEECSFLREQIEKKKKEENSIRARIEEQK